MKLIKTEISYLNRKIRDCETLIKYSNELNISELTLKIEEYKKEIKELKIEYKRINYGK